MHSNESKILQNEHCKDKKGLKKLHFKYFRKNPLDNEITNYTDKFSAYMYSITYNMNFCFIIFSSVFF